MLYTEAQVRDNIRNRDGKRIFYLGNGDQLTSGARDYLSAQRIEILPAREARKDRYAALSGGYFEEKPEHMTHLNGDYLVPKTHPRILFRGKMDSFQGEILLCLKFCPQSRQELAEILEFSHGLLRDEVLENPVAQKTLCGLTPEELRRISHFPQNAY